MANVIFSRKEFEKHVKITDEVEHKLNMMGTTVESLNDKELELEITPDRPDLLSMQGYLRSFKSFIGKTKGFPDYKIERSNYELKVDKSTPKEWPFAFAFVAKGLKIDDEKIKELIQIQEKIGGTMLRRRKKGGIGIYPLDKINFPIKFEGLSPDKIKFKPLESNRVMTAKQIIGGHPTGKMYGSIIQDWSKYPCFIDSKETIMSMPPLVNSHDVGKIDENTIDVFVESTGTDEKVLKDSLNIIATTLSDMGARIYGVTCIQKNGDKEIIPNLKTSKKKISLENAQKLLGIKMNEKDLENLFPKMGLHYSKGEVTIPAWRTDIMHEVDLIEDLAIAYGYDNIEPEMPKIATVGEESRESILKKKISEIIIGLGITEVSSYHLIKPEEAKIMKAEAIKLEDTKTDYKLLRPNLTIPSLRILAENKDIEYPHKIFEIGTVFTNHSIKSESGILEKDHLCISLTPANFTECKQVLDSLFRSLGLEYALKEESHQGFIEGRCGSIILNNKKIGHIGEIHPQTLKSWSAKMPIALIELDLEEIFNSLD